MSKQKLFKILFFPIFATLALLYFYFGGSKMEKRDVKNFQTFNMTNLNDSILKIDYYARGVELKFKSKRIVFYPVTSIINDNNNFFTLAKNGDFIIKKPFQDTLTIRKKNGKVFKYTFLKFKN